ncbi:MAG: response regulator [Syntrophorhabdaceae bacterium]|nr:response regulator [Syntrophorhabdaceae bacterium]
MNNRQENFRILIVDDNPDIRTIIKEYLEEEGVFLDGAQNGKEAFEKYEKHPFDLIITDLNMPEMDGIALLRHIRKKSEMTECIIITAYASLDSAMEAIKLGAYDYIVKPFKMEELKIAVRNAKDKITLKKANLELYSRLRSFYDEIERYRRHERNPSRKDRDIMEKNIEEQTIGGIDTERIVTEIKNLERLVKGRLMIE